jgi:hypothetical protein
VFFWVFLGVFWVFLVWLFVAAKNQGLLGRHNKVIAEIFLGTSYIWGYIWLYMVIYGYMGFYMVSSATL